MGKSRRFRTTVDPKMSIGNRFAPYCSDFFFPLLHFEGGAHLDLMGRDFAFLARLLMTAGQLLQCAAFAPSSLRMASALVVVLWPLRLHDEAVIRRAVLFGYCSIAMAISGSLLLSEFGDQLNDWIAWIQSTVPADCSEENRELAIHAIQLFRTAMENVIETGY